jgi:cobalt-zinc-cadmium efflux system outer membrane protein
MIHRNLRPWAGALLLSIHATAMPAGGTELTLRDALARAAETSPDLKSLMLELPALDGRREQAGLRPNPELGLELENVAGTGDFEGFEGAEITLALSQLIELGGKRQFRIDAVTAEYAAAEAEIRVAQLDLAAEVLRRFVRAARGQDRLELARRRGALSEQTLKTVETRVNAARSPMAELHRARAARETALLGERSAERELTAARRHLVSLWGETNPGFDTVRADLYSLPAVDSYDMLLQNVQASPQMQWLLSEARVRDAELRLAQAQAKPDLTVGGGVRRLEEADDFALMLSVQMPLTIYNRNQGAIREAGVRRQQADARYDAAFNRARADLYAFYAELEQARGETEALRGRVLPELEKALENTEAAYRNGRYSYLELVDAQRNLIEVNAALIDAAARYHVLLGEIERLTGEPLALPAYR